MNNNDLMIKEKIIEKMKAEQMTSYRLSQIAGISEAQLSRYFRGLRTLNEKSIEKIFKALNLKIV